MTPRRKFRFIQELAAGGFGKVYLAEMVTGENFSSVVAIKLLLSEWADNDEIVQRARDEARMLGRLRHRNIVRVEDLTVLQGHCAVVMEYLEGADCKSLITHFEEKSEDFPLQAIFEIIGNVASALDAAYNHVPLQGGQSMQLVHRDIKPSNVMVTVGGDVKLLDFGTARANFEEREAKTQQLAFGSQAYMAPERFLGDEDTPATDVYSLGVTLYELVKKENYGRIDLRPDKYNALVVERVGGLDFGAALPPEIADQARAALAAMVSYGPEDRPTAAQVVELMDVLSEEANDGSLRRFARKHVKAVMQTNQHTPDPDDPLTGSTLFEDRSTGFYANTESEGLVEAQGLAPEGEDEPAEAAAEFRSLDEASDELQVPVEPSQQPRNVGAETYPPPEADPAPVQDPKPQRLGGATEQMAVPAMLQDEPAGPPAPPPVRSAPVQSSLRPAEVYEPDPELQAKSKLPLLLGVAAAVLLVVGGGAVAMFSGGDAEPTPSGVSDPVPKAKTQTATSTGKSDASAEGAKSDVDAEGGKSDAGDPGSGSKSTGDKSESSDSKSQDAESQGSSTEPEEPAKSEPENNDGTAEVEPEEPEEPEEVVSASGSVSLKVLPFGSQVKIVGGGKSLVFEAKFGQPPKFYEGLAAGSYRASVTRQTDHKTITKPFTVKAGKTCIYEFNMESYQNGWTGGCK